MCKSANNCEGVPSLASALADAAAQGVGVPLEYILLPGETKDDFGNRLIDLMRFLSEYEEE